jgi:hypothetical protein
VHVHLNATHPLAGILQAFVDMVSSEVKGIHACVNFEDVTSTVVMVAVGCVPKVVDDVGVAIGVVGCCSLHPFQLH